MTPAQGITAAPPQAAARAAGVSSNGTRPSEPAISAATLDPLLRDLLAWLAPADRPYAEVMDAWRTACPRLPVWEDANDRGFIAHRRVDGCAMVGLTSAGKAFLEQHA